MDEDITSEGLSVAVAESFKIRSGICTGILLFTLLFFSFLLIFFLQLTGSGSCPLLSRLDLIPPILLLFPYPTFNPILTAPSLRPLACVSL